MVVVTCTNFVTDVRSSWWPRHLEEDAIQTSSRFSGVICLAFSNRRQGQGIIGISSILRRGQQKEKKETKNYTRRRCPCRRFTTLFLWCAFDPMTPFRARKCNENDGPILRCHRCHPLRRNTVAPSLCD